MTVDKIETPAAIVDLAVLEHNISDMQTAMDACGLKMRPHIKTHKIPEIARMQVAAGAVGITCAKVGEVEVMCGSGLDDVFIAYPVVGVQKYRRLESLMDRCSIRVGVDSVDAASLMSGYFGARGSTIDVMVEVDTGHCRTGVLPGAPALDLARSISRMKGLRLAGIFTHEGHAHSVRDHDLAAAAARDAARRMVETAELLRSDGIGVTEVSIGATPTMKEAATVAGVTEARPGSYIYNDAGAVSLGIVPESRCALRVIATVMSCPAEDRAVLDCGSKVFSSDRHPWVEGLGIVVGVEGVRLDWMNEEHGVLKLDRPSRPLRVGDRVEVIPVHACVVSNLWDEIVAVRDGSIEAAWSVRARGKVK